MDVHSHFSTLVITDQNKIADYINTIPNPDEERERVEIALF